MFDNGDWFGIWEIARCGISSGFDVTKTITIPYLAVWESLQPREGEACLCWNAQYADQNKPMYELSGVRSPSVAANALTIGKTVGELRELVERCEGAAA